MVGFRTRSFAFFGEARDEACNRSDVEKAQVFSQHLSRLRNAADIDRTIVEFDATAFFRFDRALRRIDRRAPVEHQFRPGPLGQRGKVDGSLVDRIVARNGSGDHARIACMAVRSDQNGPAARGAMPYPIRQHPEMRMPTPDEQQNWSGLPHRHRACPAARKKSIVLDRTEECSQQRGTPKSIESGHACVPRRR